MKLMQCRMSVLDDSADAALRRSCSRERALSLSRSILAAASRSALGDFCPASGDNAAGSTCIAIVVATVELSVVEVGSFFCNTTLALPLRIADPLRIASAGGLLIDGRSFTRTLLVGLAPFGLPGGDVPRIGASSLAAGFDGFANPSGEAEPFSGPASRIRLDAIVVDCIIGGIELELIVGTATPDANAVSCYSRA
jgi:hypothetical protein